MAITTVSVNGRERLLESAQGREPSTSVLICDFDTVLRAWCVQSHI